MSDPLSDLLRTVRLTGGVFLDVRMTAPWAVISQLTADDCRPFLAEPAHLIFYHVLLEGEFLIATGDEQPMRVLPGEIVLLPHNDEHTLSSEPGLQPVSAASLVRPSPEGGLARVDYGGAGPLTHMVCGFLGSEVPNSPLLLGLPKLLKLDLREGTSRDWVESSVRFAAGELANGRLPSSSVMSRLSEVLLVEAVRHYAATSRRLDPGWLKGLQDPQVGRALALIHEDLQRPWTADELAREVGMSRSVFVERFARLVGSPPMRYRTACRLQTAGIQLRETRRSIAQIAHAVGYESEEAFSRAFKRELGTSPARWRDQQSTA